MEPPVSATSRIQPPPKGLTSEDAAERTGGTLSISAASEMAITKIGMVAFSSTTRADRGCDPKENDVVYLKIAESAGISNLSSKLSCGRAIRNRRRLHSLLKSRKTDQREKLDLLPRRGTMKSNASCQRRNERRGSVLLEPAASCPCCRVTGAGFLFRQPNSGR